MSHKKKLPVLAIIGGIGSGKSVVAREFAKHAGHLINADELGHEALRQPAIREGIARRWGPDILDAQGNVPRRKLGQIVFADPTELKRLEEMVFPFIGRRIAEEKRRAGETSGTRFIVLDAAVILEAGWTEGLDHLVFVEAPRQIRLERLKGRGWEEGELARREKIQLPLEEKKRRADAIVGNHGSLEALAPQVEQLLKNWQLLS